MNFCGSFLEFLCPGLGFLKHISYFHNKKPFSLEKSLSVQILTNFANFRKFVRLKYISRIDISKQKYIYKKNIQKKSFFGKHWANSAEV